MLYSSWERYISETDELYTYGVPTEIFTQWIRSETFLFFYSDIRSPNSRFPLFSSNCVTSYSMDFNRKVPQAISTHRMCVCASMLLASINVFSGKCVMCLRPYGCIVSVCGFKMWSEKRMIHVKIDVVKSSAGVGMSVHGLNNCQKRYSYFLYF